MNDKKSYLQCCKLYPIKAFRNLILIAVSGLLPLPSAANSPVSGDLVPVGIADGKVNVADVVTMQRFLTGEAVPTPAQAILADVAPVGSPDGVINNADLLYLRRAALGLVQLDTFAPQPISTRAVTVDLSDGMVTLVGNAGSAEPLSTVTVVNTRTGQVVTVTANMFGGFETLSLLAQDGDEITVTLTDTFNNVSAPRKVVALSDPSKPGPFHVGTVEYLNPTGISGITDPDGLTGPVENVTLAWARIMYPAIATTNGEQGVPEEGAPIDASNGPYPVVLFLHGRSVNCDNDGDGDGLVATWDFKCVQEKRVPVFEGYNYILKSLASYGVFAISISADEIQPGLNKWDTDARARLILTFLDKLREWNNQGADPAQGADSIGDNFLGMLDMSRIGLSGHSRGGLAVVAAVEAYNPTWPDPDNPDPHSIVAVNTIAPAVGTENYTVTKAYQTLIGSRDGDVGPGPGLKSYDRASPTGATTPRLPKSASFVYGANHNYFNTIWTRAVDLGEPNPWAGQKDDARPKFNSTPTVMTASVQRQAALNAIVPFFRWQLQGLDGYRRVLTQEQTFSTMPNDKIFWSYQDGVRLTVDDFEQLPHDAAWNSLSGATKLDGFFEFEECDYAVCFPDLSILAPPPGDIYEPSDCDEAPTINHAGAGLRLGLGTSSVYSTKIPDGYRDVNGFNVRYRDVSGFNVLSFRAAKTATQYPPAVFPGPELNLYVTLEDGSGNTAVRDLRTDQYGVIPHPADTTLVDRYREEYWCGYYSDSINAGQLSTIRIPLQDFTLHDSRVNLRDIAKITLRMEGSEIIAIDDIEFSN